LIGISPRKLIPVSAAEFHEFTDSSVVAIAPYGAFRTLTTCVKSVFPAVLALVILKENVVELVHTFKF
jgi:hypothetical protein